MAHDPATPPIWRTVPSIIGAITGSISVIGMLVGIGLAFGTMRTGFTDLSRRMGLTEVQLSTISEQVAGLREAVVRLQDGAPTRHADAQPPASNLYTDRRTTPTPSYSGGGMN